MRYQLIILLAVLLSTIVSSQQYNEWEFTNGIVFPIDYDENGGSKGNLEEHVRQKRGWLKRVWREVRRSASKVQKEAKRGIKRFWPKKPVKIIQYEKKF
ncbi:hypothetical protein AB6A40_006250 [Gnathostoma spinigerum]|uniref:Uncharacterized protein n=1 Tax=Gnathostoma spinigerum TaxID=75299 RepID=A0ABD6EQ30_9BILA